MLILGVESSCDETGIALYDSAAGLLSHALHSQVAMHAEYGGVVPELASRDHIRRIVPLLRDALDSAQRTLADVDAVAYTRGPGLAGALLVGCAFAEALAVALDKPTIPVHHLEGHLLSPLLSNDPPSFPFVALLVSGGHTQLMQVTGVGEYQLLGDHRLRQAMSFPSLWMSCFPQEAISLALLPHVGCFISMSVIIRILLR